MSNPLVPKQISDKNGKQTTVHVKLPATTSTTTRSIPAASPRAAVKLRPAGAIGGYEIRSYKSLRGRESANFTAKLYKDGKHILDVSNDGNGGSNRYYPADYNEPNPHKHAQEFHDFAKDFNGTDYSEEGDIMFEYMVWAAQIEKLADKHGRPRAEILAAHIDRDNAENTKDGLEYLIIPDALRAKMIEAAEATTL